MRYAASEKLEIIRLVEQSSLPVRRTLAQIGIPKSTFYAQVMIATQWAASMRWKITGPDPNASGTAFQMRSARKSLSLPLKSLISARARLPSPSPTENDPTSPKPVSIGF